MKFGIVKPDLREEHKTDTEEITDTSDELQNGWH